MPIDKGDKTTQWGRTVFSTDGPDSISTQTLNCESEIKTFFNVQGHENFASLRLLVKELLKEIHLELKKKKINPETINKVQEKGKERNQ